MSKNFCLRCGTETAVTVEHINGTGESVTHKTAWRECKYCGLATYYNEEGELRLARWDMGAKPPPNANPHWEVEEAMPPFGTLLIMASEKL